VNEVIIYNKYASEEEDEAASLFGVGGRGREGVRLG
jgi:hypothetical protein